jgi:hypothetical protein
MNAGVKELDLLGVSGIPNGNYTECADCSIGLNTSDDGAVLGA